MLILAMCLASLSAFDDYSLLVDYIVCGFTLFIGLVLMFYILFISCLEHLSERTPFDVTKHQINEYFEQREAEIIWHQT